MILTSQPLRPNRLIDNKDKEYHSRYARWAIAAVNHPLHRLFVNKSLINWNFYKNEQWILEEDLAPFFLDESGDPRNRIRLTKNVIRRIVEQYRGNAVGMDFTARARSNSYFAINRREEELGRLQFIGKLAAMSPVIGEDLKQRYPIGDTPEETEQIFESIFKDEYEKDINNLLAYCENNIKINKLKVRAASWLAITGLAVYKAIEQNLEYMGSVIDPVTFFFDRGAKEPDLSDASYMGDWYYADAASVFERHKELTHDERTSIEKYSTDYSSPLNNLMNSYFQTTQGRVPVYEVYWKDLEEQQWGYVMDEFDYPLLTKINHENSDYTDKDLIDPPTQKAKDLLNGKKKENIYVDVLRYCIFIPKEEVGHRGGDIVLEYGVYPWAETNQIDPWNVKYPYRCSTWVYERGEILSPIDDAINPQRFINRLMSVAESQINNARGSGTIIAKQAIDPQIGEEGINSKINRGKVVVVDIARTGNVNNTIGSYDSTVGAGTMVYFNIMQEMQRSIEDITGVNEGMTGSLQKPEQQLVGVLKDQIQRGSIIQEPFYFALSEFMLQIYQSIASLGKMIYAESPRRLAIITGDKGARNIIITKEMRLEDYTIELARTMSDENNRVYADNELIKLLQLGMLDDIRFSNLWSRSTPELIALAVREYAREKVEAMKQKQKADAVKQEQMATAMQDEMNKQEMMVEDDKLRDDIRFKEEQQGKIDQIIAREAARKDKK